MNALTSSDSPVMLTRWRQYQCFGGEWFAVVLRPVPEDSRSCYDALLQQPVNEIALSTRLARYGRNAYAETARPLNGAERHELHR